MFSRRRKNGYVCNGWNTRWSVKFPRTYQASTHLCRRIKKGGVLSSVQQAPWVGVEWWQCQCSRQSGISCWRETQRRPDLFFPRKSFRSLAAGTAAISGQDTQWQSQRMFPSFWHPHSLLSPSWSTPSGWRPSWKWKWNQGESVETNSTCTWKGLMRVTFLTTCKSEVHWRESFLSRSPPSCDVGPCCRKPATASDTPEIRHQASRSFSTGNLFAAVNVGHQHQLWLSCFQHWSFVNIVRYSTSSCICMKVCNFQPCICSQTLLLCVEIVEIQNVAEWANAQWSCLEVGVPLNLSKLTFRSHRSSIIAHKSGARVWLFRSVQHLVK